MQRNVPSDELAGLGPCCSMDHKLARSKLELAHSKRELARSKLELELVRSKRELAHKQAHMDHSSFGCKAC